MEDFKQARDLIASGDAEFLAHYSQVPLPANESDDDVLALALCYAVKFGHVEIADTLLTAGADINARPPFDHAATPLHWAVLGDQPDCIRWLLERGADPSLCDTTWKSTPRGWAEALDKPESLSALG